MNGWLDDCGYFDFDVQGCVSLAGHALGECLDAAGIDWRIEVRDSEACSERSHGPATHHGHAA